VSVRVLVGDARAVLAGLPAESVHCAITSPPYFGLRNYSTEPVEWGGSPGCEHVWSDKLGERKSQAQQDNGPGGGVWNAVSRGQDSSANRTAFVSSMGTTCSLCGCWRGELGAEPTPELYVAHLVEVFAAVRRVLRQDGTLWVVIGDSFAANRSYQVADSKWKDVGNSLSMRVPSGLQGKELIGIPWLFAFAMRRNGWLIRQELIWSKSSCMPESVTDRCTRAHETVFMFVRQGRYFYDGEAIKEQAQSDLMDGRRGDGAGYSFKETVPVTHMGVGTNGRNKRSVWTVNPEPLAEPHYAAYPSKLVDPMVRAGTSERGVCAACLAPWRRVVEYDRGGPSTKAEREAAGELRTTFYAPNSDTPTGRTPGSDTRGLPSVNVKTLDWLPTCTCNADDPRPATVLDPFAGAGTTGLAAQRLSRDAILIELNPQYCEIIEKRLEADRLTRDPILREQATARAGGWTAPTLPLWQPQGRDDD
jgi:DNA modification methylase